MGVMELAQKRFAVRSYTGEPVKHEQLELILEAALAAPTAKNGQPWRVRVLESPDALARLAELTHCGYGAGTVLVFSYDEREDWVNPLCDGARSGVEDVSIAATFAMLRAAELGLGTVWCNYFDNAALERAFGLPETEHVVLIMPVGRPADDAHPSEAHAASKDLDELVTYL